MPKNTPQSSPLDPQAAGPWRTKTGKVITIPKPRDYQRISEDEFCNEFLCIPKETEQEEVHL